MKESKDINKDVLEFMEKQLERTNYWLAFSEAKNATLLGINIAVLFGAWDHIIKNCQKTIIVDLVFFFLLGSCVAVLISFWPNMSRNPKRKRKCDEAVNLIFYRDVAGFDDGKDYIKSVIRLYFEELETNKMVEDCRVNHVADEIIINSRIAVHKYNCFRWAVIMQGLFWVTLFVWVVL